MEDLKDVYLARIKEALNAPVGDDEVFPTSVISRKEIIENLNSYIEDHEQESKVEHERIVEMTRAECQEYARRLGEIEVNAINEGWTEDTFADAEAQMKFDFLSEIMLVTLHGSKEHGGGNEDEVLERKRIMFCDEPMTILGKPVENPSTHQVN